MLRIRPDGSIPADNPFAGRTEGKLRAVWAKGLRNPFTLAFSGRTGRFFINDVGSRGFEEVDDGRAGADYGWPATEGDHDDPRYDRPVLAYGRDVGRSIAGGAFYDGTAGAAGGRVDGDAAFPASFRGDYFVADFGSGVVQRLDVGGADGTAAPRARYDGLPFASGFAQPVDVDLAPDGALLVLQRGDGSPGAGSIGRVAAVVAGPPRVTDRPDGLTVDAGDAATFAVGVESAGRVRYRWQRDGRNIRGATGPTYTLPAATAADDGAVFRVRATNAAGTTVSKVAVLTVRGDARPTATIDGPSVVDAVRAGRPVRFAGTGTDAAGRSLPGSAMAWRVEYVSGGRASPLLAPFAGTGGSFVAPSLVPYLGRDAIYRLTLTVTDPAGRSRTEVRDLRAAESPSMPPFIGPVPLP